jgi:Amt family ammonium transporter
VGINLRNFSVFSCKQVLLCRNWIYQIKEHREYNNENLMDFCGSVAFWAIGYSLMYGSIGSVIGTPSWFFDSAADMHSCSFKLYLLQLLQQLFLVLLLKNKIRPIDILFIDDFTYLISGSWVWNAGGWLAKMGFTDFAGSSVVHSVGGWASLVAAALVGPRIGKYNTDGTVNAIPGHNLMLGALGCLFYGLDGLALIQGHN